MRTAYLFLAAVGLLAAQGSSQVLRLRTGKFLIGSVESATEDGVRFKRLDTGGVLDLDWKHINAGDAAMLRKRFHLVSAAEVADVLADAMKVVFQRGGTRREYLGELVSKDGANFVLRKRGVEVTVPVRDMRAPPEAVRVPILDILTPDEIYQRKLAETDPGEDADKHMTLGVYLIRVTDYDRAKQHLQKAQELGGGNQPKEVERQLARVDSLIKHKEEADLIAQINVLRNRQNFPKALELCELFQLKYPESKLKNEFERRKEAVLRDRETFLIHKVTADWHRVLRDEAGKIARKEQSFDAARSKAEEELPQTIRERIARQRNIAVDEVERFFKLRLARRVGKIQASSYSTGSWILGEQEVVKNTAAEQAKGKKATSQKSRKDQLKAELEKRMREWIRKANKARAKGGGAEDELQTEDEWWKEAPSTTRQLWIMAYYAEKSGDMQVVSAHVVKCPTCGAAGTLERTGSVGGKVIKVPCNTCHKTRWFRGVRFR